MDWQPIETAPKEGRYKVRGGYYNDAYSQSHGMSHYEDHIIVYREQRNPECDPPYRLTYDEDATGGIESPTHWKPLEEDSNENS